MNSSVSRNYRKEHEQEIRVENYEYMVNSLFLTEGIKTVVDTVGVIVKEKMIRTFDRTAK